MAKKKVAKKFPTPTRTTLALFLVGILLVSISVGYRFYQSTVLSFSQKPTLSKISKNRDYTKLPVEIEISKVGLYIPVEETGIVNGKWQIAQNGISHLADSSYPTEKGSIIFYGHNSKDRFGPLSMLDSGDTINVKTRDGSIYTYSVTNISVVSPSDTDILDATDKETVILYTCTGFADTKRLVIKANLL